MVYDMAQHNRTIFPSTITAGERAVYTLTRLKNSPIHSPPA